MALAEALDLSADERVHLHRLTKASVGAACQPPSHTVRPSVLSLLDRMEPTPAVVVNYLTDVLAFTTGFAKLSRPTGLLDGDQPNLVRYVFTDDRARTTYPDWEHIADERAAVLRTAAALGDPHSAEMAKQLTASAGAEFSSRFESSGDLPARFGLERWKLPEVGELRLNVEMLEISGGDEHLLIAYLPGDEATESVLNQLTS